MFTATVVLINRRARLRAKEYFAPTELEAFSDGDSINTPPLRGLINGFVAITPLPDSTFSVVAFSLRP